MNIIILSGGSGKRIWPLSNDVRSKQFIKVLKDDKGLYESMIQRIYKQIKKINDAANVTVATTEDQVPILSNQLDDEADISIEPCRRDTFPAIALTAAYMRDKKHIDERESVIICPADSYVNADYFNHLVELYELEQKTNCPICLIGIKPDSPSEKFGYIIPDSGDKISKVKEFKEKPSEQKAKEYIEKGALWNGGVFACKIKYILDKAKDLLGTDDYEKMFAEYASFEKISFDYAVVEQEKDIQVMRYSGDWTDLGTWQAFSEIIEDNYIGNVKQADCQNTHVINELKIPVLSVGLDNLIVAATSDGILVSDKNKAQFIKTHVEEMNQRPMYEERKWGVFRVLDYQDDSEGEKALTKELILKPNKAISYQRHQHRKEIWTVINGKGILLIEGKEREVKTGDVITIDPLAMHAIKAITELHIIEVQLGEILDEKDIQKFSWEWS